MDVLRNTNILCIPFGEIIYGTANGIFNQVTNVRPQGSINLDGSYPFDNERRENIMNAWMFIGTIPMGGVAVEAKAVVSEERVMKELPYQLHHFATNKNTMYTPQIKSIAEQFGLDIKGSWNTELLPHLVRHPNVYHDFVLLSFRIYSS